MEKTLIVLKPDAVQRQLVGRIVARFEQKGLKIVGLKILMIGQDLAHRMYDVHKGKDFYPRLMTFMTRSPVVAMILEGRDAVAITRSMLGPTFGPEAPAGTIRGDFGLSKRYNLVHASDSAASAEREIELFFAPEDVLDYSLAAESWIYDTTDGQIV